MWACRRVTIVNISTHHRTKTTHEGVTRGNMPRSSQICLLRKPHQMRPCPGVRILWHEWEVVCTPLLTVALKRGHIPNDALQLHAHQKRLHPSPFQAALHTCTHHIACPEELPPAVHGWEQRCFRIQPTPFHLRRSYSIPH